MVLVADKSHNPCSESWVRVGPREYGSTSFRVRTTQGKNQLLTTLSICSKQMTKPPILSLQLWLSVGRRLSVLCVLHRLRRPEKRG